MNAALEVNNLTIRYPEFTHAAVEAVSFFVEEGTITALVGPNGSGKTTLIRAILGLVNYSGEIRVLGKPVKNVYKNIGYVPQRFAFDQTFPITSYEFIDLAIAEDDPKNETKITKALKRVDAQDLTHKKLSKLSGGQLQRVLLARALVNKPKLLLLDEPETGVDVAGEQTFYDLLEKLVKKDKVTALMSSHELDIVYTYASQVVCMNKKMLCVGKPRDVLDKDTFVELYGRDLKFYGHNHDGHKHY